MGSASSSHVRSQLQVSSPQNHRIGMTSVQSDEVSAANDDVTIDHTLESELDLLADSLKRKRSDSSEGSDGQGRTPPPPGRTCVDSVMGDTYPAPPNVRERIFPIVGNSVEHPILLDDDEPEEAAARTVPTSNATCEIIVIDDDEWSDVEDSTLSIRSARYTAKKLRRAEQRAARARTPVNPRNRRTTPAVQPPRRAIPARADPTKHYPELKVDDPYFLGAKEHVERVIEYTFVRPQLLLEALYPHKHSPVMIAGQFVEFGNYRLALLGDTVLKTALIDSRMLEGESLTETNNYASRLGTNMVLARIAIHHDLQRYADLPRPDLKRKNQVHVLGTLIEAIIAAVWMDTDKDMYAVKRLLVVLYGFMSPH